MFHRIFPAIAIFVALVSCVQPSSREKFINTPSKDGIYSFRLDFTDSLVEYDLYICTRFDVKDSTLERLGDIPLQIAFFSPTLDLSSERIYYPLDKPVMNKVARKVYNQLYRSGMKGYGPWIMTIRVEDGYILPKGFCGFGIQFKRSNG